MLASLSIRDVVLIEQLDLSFSSGLCVLTGETGAGKSILLDALGLALGARADTRLIRTGAERATVAAAFDPPAGHAIDGLLDEHGIDRQDTVVLRRVVGTDGRSRAFVNDQPASVGLLRQLGDLMVEIQGQFEQRGLLDPAVHRPLLDDYGGHDTEAGRTREAWQAWQHAEEERAQAEAAIETARADQDYLRHAVEELEALDPQPDEEQGLADERTRLMNSEKLAEAVAGALDDLGAPRPVDDTLRAARQRLTRLEQSASGLFDPIVAALDRAAIELEEARAALDAAGAEIEAEPGRLEAVDDRLFALRDAARKHRIEIAELQALRSRLADQLAAIEDQGETLTRLTARVAAARDAYKEAARALSERRRSAAKALDSAIAAELPPLKLEKASFATRIEEKPEDRWSADGIDAVAFAVATNPGASLGPIAKIASGGELARFMLALRVVLSRAGVAPTLVFDEVDSGIGGATAAAVGERLARLGRDLQVLVVTHSPQVAARGDHHWRVDKVAMNGGAATTRVQALDDGARREEIARMLAGRDVTAQARAAAEVLIAGEPG